MEQNGQAWEAGALRSGGAQAEDKRDLLRGLWLDDADNVEKSFAQMETLSWSPMTPTSWCASRLLLAHHPMVMHATSVVIA